MFSKFTLLKKYLRYYFTSSNGKGHGTHSPFVYNFITKVLNDAQSYPAYENVELLRKQLFKNKTLLQIQDFGAGSVVNNEKNRSVKSIAKTALKPKKYGQLLHRIAAHYQPKNIIELGTSLGITTCYLAKANNKSNVHTLEGSTMVAKTARENFEGQNIFNIEMHLGNFDNTLLEVLAKMPSVDLAFVDGNHKEKPTLKYFQELLVKAKEDSIFIFDDIHWSREMEDAWAKIKLHGSVTITIDLFFIGIVFFRKEQKVKQHFTIRF